MLTELRTESQITLPQAIIDKMGLSVGDLLEVTELDGGVFITPVAAFDADKIRRKQTLRELFGSIDDPTFVEPPEITDESPREPIE
ncbi:MAG: hypothetical protein FWD31_11140 [Planctomycetaceae bacterium]|nr:hypothetical protein [Planctomycetaceae bacterium]